MDGRYLVILTDSAASVSAVFEEKVRRVLATNGITRVSATEWYPVAAVARTLATVGEAAGPETLRQTGERMVTDERSLSVPPSPGEAFETLDEFVAEEAHRGPAAERVAACRARRREPGRWRVAAGAGYRYPPTFAEGVFRATAATAVGVDPAGVAVESVPETDDERHAVVVSW